MKKQILLLLLLQICLILNAQMSRWIMHPMYDNIYMDAGAPVIISDSLNTSSLWDINGKRIAKTTYRVHPFTESYAVTTLRETNQITGFYDIHGNHTPITDHTIAYPDSYFSCGFLLTQNSSGYHFLNTKGEIVPFENYVKVYPFNEGFATCFTYEDIEKKKNPYYFYITADKQPVNFSFHKKTFDKEDVEFLSSLNDEGKGIAVIKRKVYFFDKTTRTLEPVFASKNETNLKRQVSVEGDAGRYYLDMNDSIIIRCKSGKADNVLLYFNKLLKPTKIHFSDRIETFEVREGIETKYASPFSPIKIDDNKWGLEYDGEVALPPQFDEVGICVNDFAVVRSNGKWGMLTHNKDLKYRLIMHDGKNIAFRHKDVATNIKLELPPIISSEKCRFDVDQPYGCTLDKISLETKNTENGNYVFYKCVLTIPESLPDVITEIQYPVQITYDGLRYPTAYIKTKAWHYKYFTVNLDDSETALDQGNVSFTINISVDKHPGEGDYPFEVAIHTDSLRTELVKISEIRYKCKLYSLTEGVNNVNVSILEEGCPPSVFPFKITYVKPIQKSNDIPEVKEAVNIEKEVEATVSEEDPAASTVLLAPSNEVKPM